MEEYLNKEKLELAKEEARLTGGDVKEIYLRRGGLLKIIEEKERAVSEVKQGKKSKKK